MHRHPLKGEALSILVDRLVLDLNQGRHHLAVGIRSLSGHGLSTRHGLRHCLIYFRSPLDRDTALIPKNIIDHRLYDHASIPATLESLFGLSPLTARDARATRLDALISLGVPRNDAPVALPAPAVDATPAARPDDTVNDGNVPGILHAAMRRDLALAPDQRRDIIARVSANKDARGSDALSGRSSRKVRQHRGTICTK